MQNFKIVDFYGYCKWCKHRLKTEGDDPCFECLGHSIMPDSQKPMHFENATNRERSQGKRRV